MVTSDNGVRRRYFDLRYDAATNANVIEGTALRYGDVATLPWGERERFEAGAFADVATLDAILNVQHNRDQAIARTGGGGLTLTDSAISLELRAELDPEDFDAKRALSKVKKGVMRGLSIEFMPLKDRLEGSREGGYTVVIEKAELRGGRRL